MAVCTFIGNASSVLHNSGVIVVLGVLPLIAKFSTIVGDKWLDSSGNGSQEPGRYIGGTMTTSRFGGGFTTPPNQISRYIRLPVAAWSRLDNGYEWTLNTWMEILSISGTRYFHGVNSANPIIENALLISASQDLTIQPFVPGLNGLITGSHATFSLNVPFMFTLVRNGSIWKNACHFYTENDMMPL
jgi:hypothetical protein